MTESILNAFDELIQFVERCIEYRLVDNNPYSQFILNSEKQQFDELDIRFYVLAFEAGLRDELPKSEVVERPLNLSELPPLEFLGKTHLPADRDKDGFMIYPEYRWMEDMLGLRRLITEKNARMLPTQKTRPPTDAVTSCQNVEGNQNKTESLSYMQIELREDISKVGRGNRLPQPLTRLSLLLCKFLVKCGAEGATPKQVDDYIAKHEFETTGRKQAIQSLKSALKSLDLIITDAQKTGRYIIIEKGK